MNNARNIDAASPLRTPKQVVECGDYTFLTHGGLRHLIFAAKPRTNSRGETIPGNGLSSAIVRLGSKLLIDLDRFDLWLEAHREPAEDE